ncbi:hypothetical protein Mapa_008963 [Marchantia paleacea]|nr:hypothetical protein Mapa_008963 [Marchantia paleacea]
MAKERRGEERDGHSIPNCQHKPNADGWCWAGHHHNPWHGSDPTKFEFLNGYLNFSRSGSIRNYVFLCMPTSFDVST